jgi:CO/xanthine dehydrogenase Mo-binding subunit
MPLDSILAQALRSRSNPRTGQIQVKDVVMAIDIGTILEPVAHQSQLDGLVSGIGVALMEGLELSDELVVTARLGDYKLPTQQDVPLLRTVLVQTSVGPSPMGAKMSGETSTAGVALAIPRGWPTRSGHASVVCR